MFEENSNAGSLVTEVDFENNLSTIGNGFSFQLGGIAKLSNDVRVGLTYDSPTWYTISEETSQYVASVRDDGGPTTAIVDPQVINIYPDYKLQTPAKITGSIALVFNQQGLISFDYSRKDYGSTKFKPESDSYFASQNTDISNNLKVANTYRIGGELRLDNFSFRGGYSLEPGPYNDTSFEGDLYNWNEISQMQIVIDYPRYFTPNDDGSHDTGNISGLSAQEYSTVYIFVRSGKLLMLLNPLGHGWDGTVIGE